MSKPVLFKLVRIEDESGVSGVGHVADGVIFENQVCVLNWRTAHSSTAIYKDILTLEAIHGHGGKTKIVYYD